ncbi:conserved hypothetical protein [Neospora caninum Liverpool]|nr:conserved hypothetical protein [Neospora caninum Liverpool]CBZ53605.1 conserved hypothetical protein [Neospora caninum Liverpool]|eukprot:XP_003883637.1 conserved hypothetical protein [Neospora caninum Liverpool]
MLERGTCNTAQLCVSFYHLRSRERVLGLFQPADEKIFFERWVLSVSLFHHENLDSPSQLPKTWKLGVSGLPVSTTVRQVNGTLAEESSRFSAADHHVPADRQTDLDSRGVDAPSGVCAPPGSAVSSGGETSTTGVSLCLPGQSPSTEAGCLRLFALPSRSTEPASLGFCSDGQPTLRAARQQEDMRDSWLRMTHGMSDEHDAVKENKGRQQFVVAGPSIESSKGTGEVQEAVNVTGDYIRELSHVETQEFEQRVSPSYSYSRSLPLSASFTQSHRVVCSLMGVDDSVGGANAAGVIKGVRRGESSNGMHGQLSIGNGANRSVGAEERRADARVYGLDTPLFPSPAESRWSRQVEERVHGSSTCFFQKSENVEKQLKLKTETRWLSRPLDNLRVQSPGFSSRSDILIERGTEQEHQQVIEHQRPQSKAVHDETGAEDVWSARLNHRAHLEQDAGRKGKQTKRCSRFSSSSWMLQEERAAQRCVERAVRQAMMKVIQVTTEKQWHLPPPSPENRCESSMYRFEINFSGPFTVSADHGWHLHLPAALRSAYSRHMPYLT